MFNFSKLLLLYQFTVVSISICASRSIDYGADTEPRIFVYIKNSPFFGYSKLSALDDAKTLWPNQTSMVNLLALEYYSEAKTLFWTTSAGELYSAVLNDDEKTTYTGRIYSALLNVNKARDASTSSSKELQERVVNETLLYSERNWYPRSMALDEVGKKLYIADTSERSIDVFDLNGQNKARLFTSEHVIPSEIVIDPSEGLLFLYAINFNKRRTELHRMNMDGSDHRLIVDKIEYLNYITLKIKDSLAIDRVNKQLYYRSSSDNISTVDYNGRDGGLIEGLILSSERLAHFEIFNNRLYWSNSIEYEEYFENVGELLLSVGFSNEKFPLRSCDLTNRNLMNTSSLCKPISEKELRMNYFNLFKIFDFAPSKKLANPCHETETACEDHCLLKPSGIEKKLSYGCACRLGRKLNNDEKTCSDLQEQKIDEESVPYVYENVWYIYNSTLDNSTKDESGDASIYEISNNLFQKLALGSLETVWDYDLRVKYKAASDGEIVKNKIGEPYQIVRNFSYNAKVLGYDWVSKNLYYAKWGDEIEEYNLFVIPTRYPEKEKFLGQIDKPTSMAVHPYRGYLFVATLNKSKNESHIVRFNTDGGDRQMLPYSNNTEIVLTVDMGEDKLYWVDGCSEENNKCIRSANLDGSDAQLMINSRFDEKIAMINIYQEQIYIRANNFKLYIFNKTSEEYRRLELIDLALVRNPILTKGKVKKTDTQYLSVKNPCVRDNGGCEIFCFAVPRNNSKNLQKACSS